MVDAVNVGDEGVKNLESLKHLHWLVLTKSNITDVSLQILAGLPSLEVLNLDESDLSDQGLRHLSNHGESRMLHLDGRANEPSRISDKGIVRLCGVSNLIYLGVENTRVTKKGARSFMGTRPKCKVHR